MKIIQTQDGSSTIYVEELDETYHSRHGAIQEAMHVFIKNGLDKSSKNPLRIFEMGFGTGLNAFLSLIYSDVEVFYTGLEKYPVSKEIVETIDYWQELKEDKSKFLQLHKVNWDSFESVTERFHLRKIQGDLKSLNLDEKFDLIYFDAFGPRAQSSLWAKEVLSKIVDLMSVSGIFVTYCAKGQVRRDLEDLGLEMQRLPGPPGKREMLFGVKK